MICNAVFEAHLYFIIINKTIVQIPSSASCIFSVNFNSWFGYNFLYLHMICNCCFGIVAQFREEIKQRASTPEPTEPLVQQVQAQIHCSRLHNIWERHYRWFMVLKWCVLFQLIPLPLQTHRYYCHLCFLDCTKLHCFWFWH